MYPHMSHIVFFDFFGEVQLHSPCMDDLGSNRPAEIWLDRTGDLFMLCSYILGWLMVGGRGTGMYNIINILMILDDSSRFLMAFSMTPMSVESRVLHFFLGHPWLAASKPQIWTTCVFWARWGGKHVKTRSTKSNKN